MHLSLLSDGYLSDSVADAAWLPASRDLGRRHRDGLLRGILFIAALLLPLGATIALSPAEGAKVAFPGTTHLRVTHLS